MIAAIASSLERQDHGGWTSGIVYADRELILAARYVADARRIVAQQRAYILKLKAKGKTTPDHELTLQAFVSTLAEMEGHAQVLAETARRLQRPRRLLS